MVLICWQQGNTLFTYTYTITVSHVFAACWTANCFHCHCMKMNIACAVNFGHKAPTDLRIFRGSKHHCLMAKL